MLLTYPGTITLSERILAFLADVRQAHRERLFASCPPATRPCWCWRTCAGGNTDAWLAAGFGVGLATAYRYVREAVGLLAAA